MQRCVMGRWESRKPREMIENEIERDDEAFLCLCCRCYEVNNKKMPNDMQRTKVSIKKEQDKGGGIIAGRPLARKGTISLALRTLRLQSRTVFLHRPRPL